MSAITALTAQNTEARAAAAEAAPHPPPPSYAAAALGFGITFRPPQSLAQPLVARAPPLPYPLLCFQVPSSYFAFQGPFPAPPACPGVLPSGVLVPRPHKGVQGVLSIDPDFVTKQMESVMSDIGVDAVKTGAEPPPACSCLLTSRLLGSPSSSSSPRLAAWGVKDSKRQRFDLPVAGAAFLHYDRFCPLAPCRDAPQR